MAICEVDLLKHFKCIFISLKSLTWICLFRLSCLWLPCFLEPHNVLFPLQLFWHNVIVFNSIDEVLETLDQTQLKCHLAPLVLLSWLDENYTDWGNIYEICCKQCGPLPPKTGLTPSVGQRQRLVKFSSQVRSSLRTNSQLRKSVGSTCISVMRSGLLSLSPSFNMGLANLLLSLLDPESGLGLLVFLKQIGLCHR